MTKVQFWPCSLLQHKDKNSLWRSLIASFILCPLPAPWAVLAAGRAQYGHISLKLERQHRRVHHPALRASVGSFVPAELFFVRLRVPSAPGVPCSGCTPLLLQRVLGGRVLPADFSLGWGRQQRLGWPCRAWQSTTATALRDPKRCCHCH